MSEIGTATTPWARGDYHRFATELVWGLGAELVQASSIRAGQRVLDVATGTGNVALRAAQAGADVVGLDITPEHFDVGRAEAAARGLSVEWVAGDAQAMPFAAGEFDAVLSAVGALFAPDQHAVAGEMLRVCRPGGTIGMINFAPRGASDDFFSLVARYAPAPSGAALPPVLWGDEDHVRRLFGDAVSHLRLERHSYVERVPGGPQGYCDFFAATFGPFVALREALEPARRSAFDRDFLAFATAANEGRPGGDAEIRYEYLLVVATRARG